MTKSTPASRLPVPAVRAALGITESQIKAKARYDNRTISARELQALDLLVAGASYAQIAAVLGLKTRGGAVSLVQRALAKRAAEAAETTVPEARALYLERLEKLFQRWYPLALGSPKQQLPPDPAAAKLVLDMLARFARVTGIESPVRVEETFDVTIHDPDAQRARVFESLQNFAARSGEVIDSTATEVDAE